MHQPTFQLPAALLTEDDAWSALLLLAGHCHLDAPVVCVSFRDGVPHVTQGRNGDLVVTSSPSVGFRAERPLTPEARDLLDVCIPLCAGPGASHLVVAHLGQSVDGRVATPAGESPEITGLEDVRFTHRMRALFDAVVVGATTAVMDDPRLTTRLVPGKHPVRIVLDPHGRVPHSRHVFHDGKARTVVVTGEGHAHRHAGVGAQVEVVAVPLEDDELPLVRVLGELAARGLRRVFIEGGGVTVSRFLAAGLVDRLEVAVAPRIIGVGEAAITLDESAAPPKNAPCRRFLLGEDVLFDFDLRAARHGGGRRA